MTDVPRLARPEERKAVAARINAETAEVRFEYGSVQDPYGELPPIKEDNWGRMWFARDPVEQVGVSFYDLPEATLDGLRAKQAAADRAGWEAIRAIGARAEAMRRAAD